MFSWKKTSATPFSSVTNFGDKLSLNSNPAKLLSTFRSAKNTNKDPSFIISRNLNLLDFLSLVKWPCNTSHGFSLFLQRFMYGFNFNRSGLLSTALGKKLNKKYGYCFPAADWGLITNNYAAARHTTSALFIRSYALNIHEDLFL